MSHAATARTKRNSMTPTSRDPPICSRSTARKWTAVPMSRKAISSRNRFIQFPGLGSILISPGKNPRSRKGRERPRPTMKKIRTMTRGVWVKANPRAVPRKGAVQGVARRTAKAPLRKAPQRPPFPDSRAAALVPGGLMTKTSKREREKRNRMTTRVRMNTGFWNWNPQPTCSPASLNPITTAAKISRDAITPAA